MMRLENKICIINGADRDVATDIAVLFARNGASVMLAGSHSEILEQTVDTIQKLDGKADFFPIKPGNDFDIKEVFEATIKTFGKPQILVNFILPVFDFDRRKRDGHERDINVGYALETFIKNCETAMEYMKGLGGGVILNISPGAGLQDVSGGSGPAAIGGGIHALTRQLALEYAHSDIRVNSLSMGVFKTDEYRRERSIREPEFEKKLIRHIPLGRLGKPEEAASTALFLASDESTYITGVVIPIDGGYSIY